MPRVIQLREGDDLLSLARDYWGDASLWFELWEANRETIGDDPDAIAPPLTLVIPDLPAAEITITVPAATTARLDKGSRQTLWYISAQVYGTPDHAALIAAASGLADQPARWSNLAAGTELRCPPLLNRRVKRLADQLRSNLGMV